MMSIGFKLFEDNPRLLDKPYMHPEALKELLSKNLQTLMDEKGLNASAWAKAAKMGHTAVRDIILKKVQNPTYSTLLKLAEAAEVDVRRITIGPDFAEVDQQDAELADISFRLSPELRQKLLAYGEGLLAGQDQPPQESDEEEQ